jgi:hypothetical protein
MKFFCLSGAGRLCRESVLDLAQCAPATPDVGIALAIRAVLLAEGTVKPAGLLTPKEAFAPQAVFDELRERQLFIHEDITEP